VYVLSVGTFIPLSAGVLPVIILIFVLAALKLFLFLLDSSSR